MKTVSFTDNLKTSDASLPTQQIQRSIQAFQNWIEKIETQKDSGKQVRRVSRTSSFTNGPYVEIKEWLSEFP